MKKFHLIALTLILGVAFILIQSFALIRGRSAAAGARPKPNTRASQITPARARASEQVSLHAAGRGRPWINLQDGHDLVTAYTGASDKLQFVESDLAQLVARARPLTLAAGDFDEDGVPDLISGYARSRDFSLWANRGIDKSTQTEVYATPGLLTLHRGNVDSIYPNTLEAEARKARGEFTDEAFLSPARVFSISHRPDFIGAGDFDADGHLDVVMAARGSNKLYWMAGDGHGGFGRTQVVELPGRVTAMTVGEINRRDGLADIVVGIDWSADAGSAGVPPAVLVFEGPEGALKHEPEAIALPAPATSFALGQLDDSYEMDLAVAAGNDLVIVHGRDRKLSLDREEQSKVQSPEVEQHSMPFTIAALAIGNFTRDDSAQVAALSTDGMVHVVEREAESKKWGKIVSEVATGSSVDFSLRSGADTQTEVYATPALVRARVSVSGMDDLVVVDRASRQLHVVSQLSVASGQSPARRDATDNGQRTTDHSVDGTLSAVTLDVEAEPVAVLPMRLNSDALSDLVILKNGGVSPLTIAPTAPLATFTVNNNGDGGDGSGTGADEKCETAPGNGVCTLRAAVEKVGKRSGGDTINFSSAFTIKPRFAYGITKPVVIDGTTSGGRVELDGSNLDGIRTILYVAAKNTVIKGLVINRATSAGIDVVNSDVTIENCYIGTDKAGTTSVGLGSIGIDVGFGTNVKIGGTVAAARNVIGNPNGEQIRILGNANTGSAIIQGNYLGVAADGSAKLATASSLSIFTRNQLSNTIGGTDPGARNLIAGQVFVSDGGIGNIIQGNYFGLTADGAALGSRIVAISIGNGSDTTIGGTTPAARNVVNGGVFAIGSSIRDRNKIQGNYVGVDPSGNNALVQGGSGGGVGIGGADCVIGGAVAGAGNVISANGDVGVIVSGATNAKVQGNLIGTNAAGDKPLGNGSDGISIGSSTGVIIGGDGPNIIAFSNRYGVEHIISAGTGVSISRNSIFGNKSLGINSGSKAPVLSMTGSSIQGTLTGAAPNKSFTIEFFSTPDCGSAGSEQGKTFIGPITTSTDGNGNSPVFTGPAGLNVTATATAVGGNTSRFSNCIAGVAPPAQINLDPAQLTFSAKEGDANPPAQIVILTNTGGMALNWQAAATTTSGGNWLGVTSPSGTSGTLAPNQSATLTVKATVGSLSALTYLGKVTVSSSDASTSITPQEVNVTFNVASRLELFGLEVTQGIQNLLNDIPLVENKPTVVRAYINNLGSGGPSITAQLAGTSVGANGSRASLGALAPSNDGGRINASIIGTRATLDDSFYFELPPDWRRGNVELEFQLVNSSLICSEPDGTPDCKTQVRFLPRRALSINFLLTTYTDSAGIDYAPNTGDLVQAVREIRANFPMDQFSGKISTWSISQEYCTAAGIREVKTALRNKRAADCRSGPCEDFYVALVPQNGTTPCAGYEASGIADSRFDSDGIKTDNSGNVNVVMTRQFNSRAHELGHNFGFRHTNNTGTEGGPGPAVPPDATISADKDDFDPRTYYGFDVIRKSPEVTDAVGYSSQGRIYGPNTPDMMSYGEPAWPSADHYTRLFNALAPLPSGVAELNASISDATTQVSADKVFLIDGSISFTQSLGTIGSVYSLNSPGSLTLPAPGAYSLSIQDSQGAEIVSYSFAPTLSSEGERGGFSLLLPWNANARRIVLLHNGQVLDSRQASANPPTVSVTSPNGGETLAGNTGVFTWTAADQDGNKLIYAVEYSTDNGATWKTQAMNWPKTSYKFDLTKLPGSNQALVRVTASDGFYSAQAQSQATFTVTKHGPQPLISSPENNRLYSGGQTIILEGMAFDAEEGPLSGSKLSWSSNLDGQLGTGQSIAIKADGLKEGTHTITLTAQDSSGLTATATVQIRVVRTAAKPGATLSVGPTGLSFIAKVGSGLTATQAVAIRNSGTGNLAWIATADQSWLKLSPTSGTAPSNISVTADATGLAVGQHTGSITITASGAAGSPQTLFVSFSVRNALATGAIIQFGSSSYSAAEGDGRATITVTRSGDTTSAASVGFVTNDAAGLQNCNVFSGIASPRCDYINTFGTFQFAAGETAKSFSVAIIDDSYAEGNETFTVSLNNPSAGAILGIQSTASVTIVDNDNTTGANPIDSTNFFVRQQYIDFLGREPDPPGFAGWTSTINNCTGDTTQCDRIHVSQLFFQSEEFQSRGYFVYRFYPVAFGRKPDYAEFIVDLARVSGFLDANQLEAAKVQFITDFMARPAFVTMYNPLNNTQYVDTLLSTAAVTLSNRQAMIDGLNNSTLTRAQVLRQIVESSEVATKYNHQAYAVMEYFGYLRRQPDAFYLAWIQVLDQSNDPRGMVTGFVNSLEYRQRFGP